MPLLRTNRPIMRGRGGGQTLFWTQSSASLIPEGNPVLLGARQPPGNNGILPGHWDTSAYPGLQGKTMPAEDAYNPTMMQMQSRMIDGLPTYIFSPKNNMLTRIAIPSTATATIEENSRWTIFTVSPNSAPGYSRSAQSLSDGGPREPEPSRSNPSEQTAQVSYYPSINSAEPGNGGPYQPANFELSGSEQWRSARSYPDQTRRYVGPDLRQPSNTMNHPDQSFSPLVGSMLNQPNMRLIDRGTAPYQTNNPALLPEVPGTNVFQPGRSFMSGIPRQTGSPVSQGNMEGFPASGLYQVSQSDMNPLRKQLNGQVFVSHQMQPERSSTVLNPNPGPGSVSPSMQPNLYNVYPRGNAQPSPNTADGSNNEDVIRLPSVQINEPQFPSFQSIPFKAFLPQNPMGSPMESNANPQDSYGSEGNLPTYNLGDQPFSYEGPLPYRGINPSLPNQSNGGSGIYSRPPTALLPQMESNEPDINPKYILPSLFERSPQGPTQNEFSNQPMQSNYPSDSGLPGMTQPLPAGRVPISYQHNDNENAFDTPLSYSQDIQKPIIVTPSAQNSSLTGPMASPGPMQFSPSEQSQGPKRSHQLPMKPLKNEFQSPPYRRISQWPLFQDLPLNLDNIQSSSSLFIVPKEYSGPAQSFQMSKIPAGRYRNLPSGSKEYRVTYSPEFLAAVPSTIYPGAQPRQNEFSPVFTTQDQSLTDQVSWSSATPQLYLKPTSATNYAKMLPPNDEPVGFRNVGPLVQKIHQLKPLQESTSSNWQAPNNDFSAKSPLVRHVYITYVYPENDLNKEWPGQEMRRKKIISGQIRRANVAMNGMPEARNSQKTQILRQPGATVTVEGVKPQPSQARPLARSLARSLADDDIMMQDGSGDREPGLSVPMPQKHVLDEPVDDAYFLPALGRPNIHAALSSADGESRDSVKTSPIQAQNWSKKENLLPLKPTQAIHSARSLEWEHRSFVEEMPDAKLTEIQPVVQLSDDEAVGTISLADEAPSKEIFKLEQQESDQIMFQTAYSGDPVTAAQPLQEEMSQGVDYPSSEPKELAISAQREMPLSDVVADTNNPPLMMTQVKSAESPTVSTTALVQPDPSSLIIKEQKLLNTQQPVLTQSDGLEVKTGKQGPFGSRTMLELDDAPPPADTQPPTDSQKLLQYVVVPGGARAAQQRVVSVNNNAMTGHVQQMSQRVMVPQTQLVQKVQPTAYKLVSLQPTQVAVQQQPAVVQYKSVPLRAIQVQGGKMTQQG